MSFDFTIKYKSENTYENPVHEAFWQFMITPENNDSQEVIAKSFSTSIETKVEPSINGFGFKTNRVHSKNPFNAIEFDAEFKLVKHEVNPFKSLDIPDIESDYKSLETLNFKVTHESDLSNTKLTTLSKRHQEIYTFDQSKSIMDNLMALNHWTYIHLYFKTDVTDVNTILDEIIEKRHGVCQDFSHLFIAIARQNKVPARYISGYLHQGDGFFGDSQMHAWIEAYIPQLGWVGFDPTNDVLANHNHIKVCHGRDYNDCPPIKGVIYSTGRNETKYSVEVTYQQ